MNTPHPKPKTSRDFRRADVWYCRRAIRAASREDFDLLQDAQSDELMSARPRKRLLRALHTRIAELALS